MDGRLGAVESRFADIVWDNAPLTTGELIKLCERELHWKRTTTYTVLKKFCERGLFQLEEGVVSVLTPRSDYYAACSQQFVDAAFHGSLPAFITAFTSKKRLSQEEVRQIREMIDSWEED